MADPQQPDRTTNLAETLAREMKAPIEIASEPGGLVRRVALPPGWTIKEHNDETLASSPRRKTAKVKLHDAASFIGYIDRHAGLDSTIWCVSDYKRGQFDFVAIINDNGKEEGAASWRDHTASFQPEFSAEWASWFGSNKKPFTQAEFAEFLETNLRDIAQVEASPSGAQMLDMALSFEANQDMKFKSAIRLQSGGVQMAFVQDDDAQTLQKMQMFDRFSLGLPVFWDGDPYRMDARLRYRVREGKLTFWYELIRADKVLEAAAQTLISSIREATGSPFFFGKPYGN